ncbi:FAD-dependent oxidoreductase [Qipengyuania seohaensis]|uniref:FAD-dependent oxidoreductase n=1 Tax=Qipengyuania seohaensis TaxID=266951 RepID=UPI000C224290|nr:FAD-dependent oxidoreductase [Qipengyuania seohaensis]
MSGKTLLLVGAGHAHLGVIDDIRKDGLPCEKVVIVEPRKAMHYSGMVPGWLAGEYRASEAMIPLQPLVEEAGIEWVQASAVGIDASRKTVRLDTGDDIAFDICSIAIGGAGRARRVLGDDPRLLDIRPIDRFVDRWRDLRDGAAPPRRIAVVGGGAGGLELAIGLANAPMPKKTRVTLIAGEGGLLSDHAASVQRKARAELAEQGIRLIESDASFGEEGLCVAGEELKPPELIVAAIGSGAPAWPRESGLAVDGDGFIEVDRHQRSCSHAHIFAVGDVARRTDRRLPHSGVHAVYAGPVLADNLRRALDGRTPTNTYRGRGMDFYLFNTGRGEAILSYGPVALKTRWLRKLKDWLDRRWIDRFTR